ncbi:putative 7-deoxyloganetic acid glucosyltransferase-like [Sesbania bispinosa]|nr:putative 7-deoxyloganetic acid glucosyltransferase-like [Sesbania bispinosa]
MQQSSAPHILVLPFPAEGHIKPMFNLAKLLCYKGQRVTLVNSHHYHARLHQFTDLAAFHTQFHFASITDGIPQDHPRLGTLDEFVLQISPTSRSLVAIEFRELFLTFLHKNSQWQPPSCIIADGLMSTIAMAVAQEFHVPLIIFRIYSATCTWNNQDGQLRKEDKSCITWLDHQKAKSVLYVSFGTVVKLSHEQLLEFWFGLVNSLKPFLWVIRSDLVIGGENLCHNNVPLEVQLGTKERGIRCGLGPGRGGVPMLCWPQFVDQTVNSRCVSEGWRIGLDMNGTCDRFIVEKMVRDLMENRIEELTKSANDIAEKARNSVKENGSSCHNLDNLIKDIRSMKVRD